MSELVSSPGNHLCDLGKFVHLFTSFSSLFLGNNNTALGPHRSEILHLKML